MISMAERRPGRHSSKPARSVPPPDRPLRVAWSRDLGGAPIDNDQVAVLDAFRPTIEGLGWEVVDDPLDGNIVCTIDGRGDNENCDTCDTYNIYVWEDGSPERHCAEFNYDTVAGEIYSAHTPCECGDNLDLCDTWSLDCIPD